MDTTHIYLNSEDRENFNETQPSNFRVSIHKELYPKCLELSFAQIPNVWYNITVANNTFQTDTNTYTVPIGCYTLSDLLQNLATQTGLTFAYNDITNRITISSVALFGINKNTINRTLGFLDNFTYADLNSYTGSFGPKIHDSAIFISCNINQGVMTSSPLKNCTFCVPVNVNKSEVVQFYSKTQFSISPKCKEMQYFDIRVFDEAGRELEGMSDWSMLIKLYY